MKVIYVAVIAGTLVLCGLARGQEQGPFEFTEFSAAVVMSAPGKSDVGTIKMYRSGDRMRTEFPQMGKQAYFLSLLSTHTGHFVMDPAKIEQITIQTSTGHTVTMKAWNATDLHRFRVRAEMPTPRGTTRMDFKDVGLSSPPASLFLTPTNCREMPAMPGAPY
jgi:hypothetical protein